MYDFSVEEAKFIAGSCFSANGFSFERRSMPLKPNLNAPKTALRHANERKMCSSLCNTFSYHFYSNFELGTSAWMYTYIYLSVRRVKSSISWLLHFTVKYWHLNAGTNWNGIKPTFFHMRSPSLIERNWGSKKPFVSEKDTFSPDLRTRKELARPDDVRLPYLAGKVVDSRRWKMCEWPKRAIFQTRRDRNIIIFANCIFCSGMNITEKTFSGRRRRGRFSLLEEKT